MDWLTDLFGGPLGTNLFGGGNTAGAGRMMDGMPVPGMPATGKPIGMLRAGGEGDPTPTTPGQQAQVANMMAPDGPKPIAMARAGTEPMMPSRGLLVDNPVIAGGGGTPALAGGGGGGTDTIGGGPVIPARPPGGAGRSDGPPLATPPQAAAARVTLGTPTAVSGNYTPTPATPGVDPAFRAPYANPGTAIPGAPSGTPPVTTPIAPAATPPAATPKPEETPFLQRFNEALGKAQIGAGQKGTPPRGAGFPNPGSMGGDPTSGARQGAADLLAGILSAHRKLAPGAGAIPKMPESLLRRL